MLGLNAGTAYVQIRPDLRGFHTTIKRELAGLDREFAGLGKSVRDEVSKGLHDGLDPTIARRQGTRAGDDFGGAFDRQVRSALQKAQKSLPPLKIGAATTEAEQKLRDLQSDMQRLSDQTVGVDVDSAAAMAELDRIQRELGELGRASPDVQVRVDSAAAIAQLATVNAAVERLDGKDVTIDVNTRGAARAAGFMQQTSLTMGQMIVAAGTLGTALIPVTAAVAGLGAALSAPLAGAGLGATVFGVIAGVAVSRTNEQIKEIDALKEAVAEADTKMAKRQAMREYRNALEALSPAQTRFMRAQDRLSNSFDRLTRRAGGAIFRPLIQGMNLLSRILPMLQPVLRATSRALSDIIGTIARAVQGPVFQNFLRFFTSLIGPSLKAFATIAGNVALGVMTIVRAFAPLGGVVLQHLVRFSRAFADFVRSAAGREALQGFIGYLKQIGPLVMETLGSLLRAGANLVKALAPIGGVVLAAINLVAKAIANLPAGVLTGIITAIVVALVAFKVAMIAASVAALGTAGLIAGAVVAGIAGLVAIITIAWHKWGAFREAVKRAWHAIVIVSKWAWENVIKPIFRALGAGIRAIAAVFRWWWHNVTVPAFRAIAAAARWLWNNVLKPVWRALIGFIRNVLWPVIHSLWVDLFRPVLRSIAGAVKSFWNNVLRPVFRAIVWFFKNVVFPVIRFMWEHVWKPILKLIGGAVKFWWNNVLKPAFKALWWFLKNVLFPVLRFLWQHVVRPVFREIGQFISARFREVTGIFRAFGNFLRNNVFPVFRFLWNHVVKPVMKSIGDWISRTWKNTIKPVFEAIGDFIRDKVVPAFRRGVNAIGDAWDNLKRLAAIPVNFVIKEVYNEGLRGFVNSVLEKFPGDAPKLPYVKPIFTGNVGPTGPRRSARSRPGLQRASGGVLPGYTPGRDVHHYVNVRTGHRLSLSGGEAIMRPEWTRAVGGARAVDGMNARARKRKRGHRAYHGDYPSPVRAWKFFKGGTAPVPGGVTNFHGTNYYGADWAGDFAVPIGTPVKAYQQGVVAFTKRMNTSYGNHIGLNHMSGVATLYAHLSQILVRAGQAVRAAQVIGKSGSTGNSTGPHLHFEIQGATFRPSGDSGGILGGALDWVGRLAASAVDRLTGPIMGLLDKVPGADTTFGSIVVGAGKRAVQSVADWVTEKFGGSTGAGAGAGLPAGVRGLRNIIAEVLRQLGLPLIIGAVMNRIQHESGGNPRIVNNWDSNAAAGTPSVGLMQVIGPTYQAYKPRNDRGPYIHGTSVDPYSNIFAGVNYAMHRYGRQGLRGLMNRPGGYALGGVLPAKLYDRGGMLQPGGVAVNRTRRPEPVFTDRQWRLLRQTLTRLTMNQARPISGGWLTGIIGEVPKTAEQLRREFIRLRDSMRGFRVRTEQARRALERIQETKRYERRAEEFAEAEKAFKRTRTGEEIAEELVETRRLARRKLRRARRTPIARDALRDFRRAQRKLEKERTTEEVDAAKHRTRWRRQQAREDLRAATEPERRAREALERAREDEDRQAIRRARRRLRIARAGPDSPEARRARTRIEHANRRLKTLDEESERIERLQRQRTRAGRQSDVVHELAQARQRIDDLRAERAERKRLRREMLKAGRADILKREERLQERLNKAIDREKEAMKKAKAAAAAYKAAQEAAIERARSILQQGIELGGIGAATAPTGRGILANLQRAVRTVRQWKTVTLQLIGAGLRGPILDEYIAAGPSVEAVRTGKSLLAAGQIGRINALQEQLRRASVAAGAIGARSYTPAQRAVIRRAHPVAVAPGSTAGRQYVIAYTGMPADTVETIVAKTTQRVRYEIARETQV